MLQALLDEIRPCLCLFCGLQGILNDVNEQDTSFLDCQHKHMMKSRAPPDKVGVMYRMFTSRIPWFHKQN